jgi:hypothetical protein
LPWALAFFYQSNSFASPNCKTHWTMPLDNVGFKICLLGTSNFMVPMTFFFLVKWSHDNLNSQS